MRVILTNEVRECGDDHTSFENRRARLVQFLESTRTKQERGRSALVKDERVWKTSLGVADRSHGTTVMNGELRRGPAMRSSPRYGYDQRAKSGAGRWREA